MLTRSSAKTLWPQPYTADLGNLVTVVESSFSFILQDQSSQILVNATERYMGIIFPGVLPSHPQVTIAHGYGLCVLHKIMTSQNSEEVMQQMWAAILLVLFQL